MDSSEWELSKENVQPIKQGRKIPNLTAALTPCGVTTGDDALYWKRQKDKQNFEAEIRTYEGDDYLDVWYRYILWMEENVPKGGRDIETLLERCIEEFKDESKYKNDERYLNVWLKYANCCSDPLEIFNYLHTKSLCSSLALFYIAWSSVCENIEDFQKADQVLMLGIEKNAQPLEMLQKHHIGFQHRLTAHIETFAEENEHDQENQRKALASLATSGKKKIVGAQRNSSFQNLGWSRSTKSEKKGLGFSILHDTEENKSVCHLPDQDQAVWKAPPMESVMTKENVNIPGKWTGENTHSKRPSSSTTSMTRSMPKQSFQVHVDESAKQSGPVHLTLPNQVLSVRKSDSETSNNPLKVLSNSAENSGVSKTKVMYDKCKVYTGTEEFQFEEIHAATYMLMVGQGLPLRKEINRAKRERNGITQAEKKERVRYQKNRVYAYEGEFQPEEIRGRIYYERMKQLRMGNKERASTRIDDSTKKPLLIRKTPVFRVINDAENIPPGAQGVSKTDAVTQITIQNNTVQNDSHTISSHSLPAKPVSTGVSQSNVQNFHILRDDENRPPTVYDQVKKVSSPEESQRITLDENGPPPNYNNRGPNIYENVPLPNVKNIKIYEDEPVNVAPLFCNTQDNIAKSGLRLRNETSHDKKSDVVTPNVARCKTEVSDIGPSPTLTTKEAFADVLPWFNTTVGLSTSDDELEREFKNGVSDDENDVMGWSGVPFRGMMDFKKEEEKDVDNYYDENQENLPPSGYNQTKTERPVLGVLQPSVGIPFEPLEDFKENKNEMREDTKEEDYSNQNTVPVPQYEILDFPGDETTYHIGLNNSKFTAALMSTPFVQCLSPPKLDNLQCSSIQPHDEKQIDLPTNVSTSSYNANSSKGLSPILECSDEDGKTGSSKGSLSSTSLSKSNVHTTQSSLTNHSGATYGKADEFHSLEIENRSMDVTVHDMNGSVLKKINPFDPELCNNLLAHLARPVTSSSGYHDLKGNRLPKFVSNQIVVIGDETFKVNGMVGSGAYAKVFSATRVGSDVLGEITVALKVQRPANDWEFYVCSELLKRMKQCGKSELEIASIVNISDYYAFANGSCSVTRYHQRGTFLDFVNECKKNENIREETALYYAIQMMNILQCIHDCGIIHGDIKPDNFVLLENHYSCTRDLYTLGLIDFGRAIDTNLFPPGTRFSVDKNTESFECIEMKTNRAWTTQVDTYGMLCCLHCLIFGEYMNVYQDKESGCWKQTKSFNRSWNRALWNKLFDMFLNIPSCDNLPSLSSIHEEFQDYFQDEDELTCDFTERKRFKC